MGVANKKSIAVAARELGVKHLTSSSKDIVFDESTSMQIILVLLSFVLTQLFTNTNHIKLPPILYMRDSLEEHHLTYCTCDSKELDMSS